MKMMHKIKATVKQKLVFEYELILCVVSSLFLCNNTFACLWNHVNLRTWIIYG